MILQITDEDKNKLLAYKQRLSDAYEKCQTNETARADIQAKIEELEAERDEVAHKVHESESNANKYNSILMQLQGCNVRLEDLDANEAPRIAFLRVICGEVQNDIPKICEPFSQALLNEIASILEPVTRDKATALYDARNTGKYRAYINFIQTGNCMISAGDVVRATKHFFDLIDNIINGKLIWSWNR